MYKFTSLILLLGLVSAAVSQSCNCGAGLQCCQQASGNVCYDPASYSCPVGSAGPLLCGNQNGHANSACGSACYDPTSYQCCSNNQIYQIQQTCPGGTVTSPPATSAPTTSVPTTQPATSAPTSAPTSGSSSTQCSSGLNLCRAYNGDACYDPTSYSCPSGTSGFVLCGFADGGAQQACGTTCFPPSQYGCCNGQLLQIGNPTLASCGSTATQAPTPATTQAPTTQAPTTTVAPTQTQTPTQAPSQSVTPAPTRVSGSLNITASSVYNYYFYVNLNSYSQDLGSGESVFPYEIEWYANRVETYGNGLVLVFDPSVSVGSDAVLIVNWRGVEAFQGQFNVIQSNCSNTQYTNCTSTQSGSNFAACYPYVSYYDITICPCGDCQKLQTFQVGYGTGEQFDTTLAATQPAAISLGKVNFPLTLSMTTISPTQGNYAAVIESVVLNYSS